ncbi:hypothetical protein BD310DRAFT_249258 [Dichomitus squalens]|uniref:Uncharacterized protein n=1 Tax=Dichomitus squalens TaxID=114155 RepID=A0A4Q9PDN4_9APHY|nr:hypothetical protein BD310DRAFT_249258 [Dichomitus squalens]
MSAAHASAAAWWAGDGNGVRRSLNSPPSLLSIPPLIAHPQRDTVLQGSCTSTTYAIVPKAHFSERIQSHTANDGQHAWDDADGVCERNPQWLIARPCICSPCRKTNEAKAMRFNAWSGSYARTVAMHPSMLWGDACGFGPKVDSSCFVGPEACIAPHSLMVQKKTTEGVAMTFNSVAPSDHSRTSPPVPLISPQIGRIYGQRTHPTFHLPSQLLDASECAI